MVICRMIKQTEVPKYWTHQYITLVFKKNVHVCDIIGKEVVYMCRL